MFPSTSSPNGVCKSSKNLTCGISTVKAKPVVSLIPPSYPPSPEIVVLIEKADISTFPNGESDPSSVSFCSKFWRINWLINSPYEETNVSIPKGVNTKSRDSSQTANWVVLASQIRMSLTV